MLAFNEFFSYGDGMQEFTDTLKFVAGRAPKVDQLADHEVIHVAQLPEAAHTKAVKL